MMEDRYNRTPKAGQNKCLNTFSTDVGDSVTLEYSEPDSGSLRSSTHPECQLASSIEKSQKGYKIISDLIPGHFRSHSRISKRITSFDEKYLGHCLELIQISAAKAASLNISISLSPSNISSPTDNFKSPKKSSFEFPLQSNSGDVVVSPLKKWIVGSETRSRNMINVLQSPLFTHGTANNSGANDLASFKGSFDSINFSTPSGLSLRSSPLPEKEGGKRKYGSESANEKNDSNYMSSMISTSSDLSSASSVISHGTLKCTWSYGVPHFVFSLDNKREVYVAKLSKIVSSSGNGLDWSYFFCLQTSNRKKYESYRHESVLVGRMNVSARYRICADKSRILETEFILYGDTEYHERDTDSSIYQTGKHRRRSGKVSKLLKPLHLRKNRFHTNTWGTSTTIDYSPSKTDQDDVCDPDPTSRFNLKDSHIPPNFELAAVVVKECVQVQQPETEAGGWGLSFLKRAKEKQGKKFEDAQEFSDQANPSTVETSMDILVPAGYHGGPNTSNGGPSRLTERWSSGGQCDCRGWDTGCPLTVLNIRPSKEETENQGGCKVFDLFRKGSEGRAPSIKMVNIQAGLYYINFQSTMSALQCFSIAVAVIHNKSPSLRPKVLTK